MVNNEPRKITQDKLMMFHLVCIFNFIMGILLLSLIRGVNEMITATLIGVGLTLVTIGLFPL